ncbi:MULTISPECIES: restriction endonuclease subunit S [unclassified Corynebacterium]
MSLEWIEGVPADWYISEAQFVLDYQKRDVQEDDEIVTAFRDGQVTLRRNRRTDGFTMAEKEIGYQHICEGDLVVHSMDGGFGAIGVSDSCGKASPVVHAYTSSLCDLRFVAYQLRAAVKAGWIAALAKGIRVRSTQFDRPALASLKIAYPTVGTQRRIADYLDRETAEIDAAVADLDKYVELLEKRRLEMIRHKTQFDAKGSAWERCSTSVVFRSIGGGTTPKKDMGYYTSNEDENGAPWVTTSELRESLLQVTKVCVTPKALREVSSLRIHPAGSVVIAMYGATIGRLGILGVPATTNQACCVFSEPKGVDLKFFYYSLWADREAIIRHSSGGGQPNISQAILQRWKTPLPPLEAQREIADYLDHESDEIDSLIAESTKLRDLLLKRRSVLITEVVTGRKQV